MENLKYSDEQRREYLNLIDRVSRHWLEVFEGNTEFYNAMFWDLLTGIWRKGGQVRKTDAAKLMVGVKSAQTAAKYVDAAIEQRILLEKDNPKDARSRLVVLAPEMQARLDQCFDKAIDELKRANEQVDTFAEMKSESTAP